MKAYFLTLGLLLSPLFLRAQSEFDLVAEALNKYIQGTSYTQPETILDGFDENANLYLTQNEDELRILPVTEYVKYFEKSEPGTYTGREGKIMAIDVYKDIAMAKVEIKVPKGGFRFVDMFLVKKIKGTWKIIAKSTVKESL